MADFDRTYRDDFRSHADFDRGHGSEFAAYGGGERRLEVVKGSVFSASRPPPAPPRAVVPASSSGAWCFGDPEMQRRRRVASYKVYSVEGKVKASLRKGFRWIKGKCSEIIHGW
ncbi:uncharacterized protein [Typha angustifolia]|uniref:uncharacterized protein n=1 Tax=Typha angustifolia TaxID=59011 RepID=UPI003C2E5CD7